MGSPGALTQTKEAHSLPVAPAAKYCLLFPVGRIKSELLTLALGVTHDVFQSRCGALCHEKVMPCHSKDFRPQAGLFYQSEFPEGRAVLVLPFVTSAPRMC